MPAPMFEPQYFASARSREPEGDAVLAAAEVITALATDVKRNREFLRESTQEQNRRNVEHAEFTANDELLKAELIPADTRKTGWSVIAELVAMKSRADQAETQVKVLHDLLVRTIDKTNAKFRHSLDADLGGMSTLVLAEAVSKALNPGGDRVA